MMLQLEVVVFFVFLFMSCHHIQDILENEKRNRLVFAYGGKRKYLRPHQYFIGWFSIVGCFYIILHWIMA